MHGGWELHSDNPYSDGGVETAAWYHESESAGSKQAWQTHYPALTTGLAGKDVDIGQWKVNGDGRWVQEYRQLPSDGSASGGGQDATATKFAGWFENSIRQYDGFGRPKHPMPGSRQELLEGKLYTSRSVHSPLTCKTPGCTGNATLQAFAAGEDARKCRLSLWLHPTDFDDGYSGERLTFIKVNGVTVNTDCFPMVDGCNATTQKSMFPCLQDQLLDTIIDQTGKVEVSAGIPDVVDECPYEGNLLSAVAIVSCLVPPPAPPSEAPKAVPKPPTLPKSPKIQTLVQKSQPFRCDFRGCAAEVGLNLRSGPMAFKQCLVSIYANATDFDGEDGTNEWVDYVRLNGTDLLTNFTPRLNPCRSAWAGKPLTPADIEFPLVVGHDVTDLLAHNSSGLVMIEVKISDFVDECAHDGYLLTGRVDINCTIDVQEAGSDVTFAINSSGSVSASDDATAGADHNASSAAGADHSSSAAGANVTKSASESGGANNDTASNATASNDTS